MSIIAHDAPLLQWILSRPNAIPSNKAATAEHGRMPVLHLVSCVTRKRDQPAPARELYCSPWFRLVRALVEAEPWAILSARHGLVWPDTIIEPYDATLANQSAHARRSWADLVYRSLPPADRYVIWAGRAYAEFLSPALNAELPLRGLGIGEQLAFLRARQSPASNNRSLNPETQSCLASAR